MGRETGARLVEVWRDRVRRQQSSGLTIEKFCRKVGVSTASFYHWRKRLEGEATPRFVPVELPASCNGSSEICIELPCGAVVRLPGNISAELLVAAIAAARCDSDPRHGGA